MKYEAEKKNVIEAAKLNGWTVVDKTYGEDYHPFLEITTKNGNVISFGRPHYTKEETHWNVYPVPFVSNNNVQCRPSDSQVQSSNISKSTNVDKLAKAMVKFENNWLEWFNKSKAIKENSDSYNNSVTINTQKILATGKVTKNNNNENLYLNHNNSECFGNVSVSRDTARLELSNIPIDKVIAILNLL